MYRSLNFRNDSVVLGPCHLIGKGKFPEPDAPSSLRRETGSAQSCTFYLSLPFYLYSLQVRRQLPLQDSEWLFPWQQASGEQPEALAGNFSYLNGKCDTHVHSHSAGREWFLKSLRFFHHCKRGRYLPMICSEPSTVLSTSHVFSFSLPASLQK